MLHDVKYILRQVWHYDSWSWTAEEVAVGCQKSGISMQKACSLGRREGFPDRGSRFRKAVFLAMQASICFRSRSEMTTINTKTPQLCSRRGLVVSLSRERLTGKNETRR
jgi:hypothetical protein